MTDVRFAIVGYGNIGRTHANTLLQGEVQGGRLTAVVSRKPIEAGAGIQHFHTIEDALAADIADAIVVATPTMTHMDLGRTVLAANHHLVMEKPIAMSVGEASELCALVPAGVHAAVMLNQRYHSTYAAIKRIVSDGTLGRIVRFNWVMTAWYRPDVYYLVSTWRGTWPGEGGGALLNQCIHNLDILQWVLGLPRSVFADVQFGKYHDIEVEDEVTAVLSFKDGATGVVVASTGEAPGLNQLDIVGDRGSISFDGETLCLQTAAGSVAEHCASTKDMFGVPEFDRQEVTSEAESNQHARVLQNVVDAVREGKVLETPLTEGLGSLELANAILLSAWEQQKVTLPIDVELYQQRLAERIADSGLRQAQDLDVNIDMDASYR